jgi:hypothetical protein
MLPPKYTGPVFQCLASQWKDGRSLGIGQHSLVFKGVQAFAVLVWVDVDDGVGIGLKVPLDSKWLHKQGESYMYERPIEWPPS